MEDRLREVHQLLERLPPPFTVEREILNTHKVKVPYFFQKLHCWDEHDHDHEEWMRRWAEIEEHLSDMPAKVREGAALLLQSWDTRLRIATETYAKQIAEYQIVLKNEDDRIHLLMTALKLETLFPLPLSALSICEHIRAELITAKDVVTQAERILEPVRSYYANQKDSSRRQMKEQFLALLLYGEGKPLKRGDKAKATKLADKLLSLADPLRATTHGSFRQMDHGR